MSSVPQSPPATPDRVGMAIPNGVGGGRRDSEEQRGERVPDHLDKQMETLAVNGSTETIQVVSSMPPPPSTNRIVTPQDAEQEETLGGNVPTSKSPGELPAFDWVAFEAQYLNALAAIDAKEKEALNDFNDVVKYFNVRAMASSNRDTDRALKRLKTREVYVQQAEEVLEEKQQHQKRVVKAFEDALAILAE